MRKYLLPFNDNPLIKCYASHGSIFGILLDKNKDEAYDAFFSELIFNNVNTKRDLSYNDIGNFDVKGESFIDERGYFIKSPTLKGIGDIANRRDCFGYLHQVIDNEAEVIAKLDYQKNSFSWAKAGLMLRETLEDDARFIMIARTPANGIRVQYRSTKGGEVNDSGIKKLSLLPIWFKLKIENGFISLFTSEDLSLWEQIGDTFGSEFEGQLYVGISVSSCENEYLNWLFCNFIQLSCNKDLRLDYYLGPRRDMFYHFFNPLIKFQCINRDVIALSSIDIIDFIINTIRNHYYISLNLNEYFVPDRGVYQTDFYCHENVVFGYNLDDETLNIAGYTDQMHYKSTIITFDEFKNAYSSESSGELVYLLSPSSTPWIYEFNISTIVESLKDYLYSYNSSQYYKSYMNVSTDRIFGINIYDYLIDNLDAFAHYDYRQLSVLYEHKLVMISRLDHIYKKGYLDKFIFIKLLNVFESIKDKMIKARNLQLKIIISRNNELIPRVKDLLIEIKRTESQAIEQLLNSIEEYLVKE